MMFRSAVFFLFFVLLSGCAKLSKPPAASVEYLIKNVNVVDVVSERILHQQDVLVRNGVIKSVSDFHDGVSSTTEIDGSGKYLIPGLWDSHAVVNKLAPQIDFPLYIANGVTSIRSIINCPNEDKTSLYACMKDKADWDQQVETGAIVGPRIMGSATFPINGTEHTHPDSPDFYSALNIEQADKIIEHYNQYSVATRPHSLKLYNWLKPEVYKHLVTEANASGFKVSGHKPRKLSLLEAIDAGQYSFAHARLFLFECSTRANELIAGKHWDKGLSELYSMLLETYDEAKCQTIYKAVGENQTFLSPTLLTRRNDYLSLAGLREQVRGIEYSHYMFEREWNEDIEAMKLQVQSKSQIDVVKRFYQKAAATIGQAYRHGALILAGTDTYDTSVVPGFSLHEELIELSKAGVDNFGVLRAASLNMAKYFEVEDIDGSIDVGKVANMVLLNGNPIDDITHTSNIAMVFQKDRVYTPQALDNLKQSARGVANGHGFTAELVGLFLRNPTGF